MREAFDRLGADLRGEIRASAAEARVYIDERVETTRVYVDGRFEAHTASLIHEMRESESRTRRHFDVVGESLRGEIRGLAELNALRARSPSGGTTSRRGGPTVSRTGSWGSKCA